MKTMKYGRLEVIQFKISERQLFELLKKLGEIPEGFYPDDEPENCTEWPIQLDVKRVIPDQVTDRE